MPTPILDSSWERRIANGSLAPDMTVDLHDHTLATAHRRLDQALGMARSQGARVLLVVTGNPRPVAATPLGEKARGAIRAEIGDWLALSGHADSIASVRTAHPRHGGKGALYVILRKRA
ncbi:MAG: Smr/MutS family protein [Sphingobium sp.]